MQRNCGDPSPLDLIVVDGRWLSEAGEAEKRSESAAVEDRSALLGELALTKPTSSMLRTLTRRGQDTIPTMTLYRSSQTRATLCFQAQFNSIP
jgi:hypothetical protein